jgi:hypothetical protein
MATDDAAVEAMKTERAELLKEFVQKHHAFELDAWRSRALYYTFLVLAIVLGTATGVLAALEFVDQRIKIVVGFAAAAITALNTHLPFKRDWARSAIARDRLWIMIRRYRAASAGIAEAERLRNFNAGALDALEKITEAEQREWLQTLAELEQKGGPQVQESAPLPRLAAKGGAPDRLAPGSASQDHPSKGA